MPQIINKNIRFLREQAQWTQKELAAKLNIKSPAVGAYEEFRATPPIPVILKIADLFKVDLDSLLRKNLVGGTKSPLKKDNFLRGQGILSITVDSQNKENVELVTQKASAGYLNGYADPEFVKELPKISIPSLTKNATHRGFEIKGDSMLPVKPGDIIIGKYVENLEKIKDGKTYVIVSASEGIVYKRIFSFAEEEKLLLVSDNRNYKPYLLNIKDVTEIWAFTARITMDDVVVETTEGISLDFLASKWIAAISKPAKK
jgi:transcriptional regulator with XRE-family HTH domain